MAVEMLLGVPFLHQDDRPGVFDVGEQATRTAAGLDPDPSDQRFEGVDDLTAIRFRYEDF
jgi:hypothetical protein